MDTRQITSLLAEVQLFSELSKKDLGRVVQSGRTIEKKAGSDVVTQGSDGHAFFLLLNGGAEVMVDGQLVARLGPGDCFGESSLLTKAPRNATVCASVDAELFALPSISFRGLVKENPSIAIKLLEAMASRSSLLD